MLLTIMSVYNGSAWHGDPLREMLEGVTEEVANSRPIPTKKTIHELTLHIAAWMDIVARRLAGEVFEPTTEDDFPRADAASWEDTMKRLQRSHERLLDQVARCGDDDLDRGVPGKAYSFEFMLNGLAHHTTYHEGQIALLKTLSQPTT